ncbi:MAG: tail fiber domain-containing protein, partial [Bacteroidota bacterium]
KTQVQENVPGLDFITRLRPVTYHLDIHKQNEMCFLGKKDLGEWDGKYDIEQKQFTGFIAQEVEQAAKAVGYDFSGVEKAADEVGMYSVRYSDFVMPLVKAVQEQQIEIEQLKTENERLKKIEAQLDKITAALHSEGFTVEK